MCGEAGACVLLDVAIGERATRTARLAFYILGVNSNPLSMHERVFRPVVERVSYCTWRRRSRRRWTRPGGRGKKFVTVTKARGIVLLVYSCTNLAWETRFRKRTG